MQPAGNAPTIDRTWLHQVRLGAALVFWSLLLPPVLANGESFFSSFFGHRLVDPSLYRWVFALASLPLLAGAWLLTTTIGQPKTAVVVRLEVCKRCAKKQRFVL